MINLQIVPFMSISIEKILTIVVLLFVSTTVYAQSIGDIDFRNLKADELTDEQVLDFYARAQAQGLSLQDLERLAVARGVSSAELSKLRARLAVLQNSDQGNSGDQLLLDSFFRTVRDTTRIDSTNYETFFRTDSSSIFGANLFRNKRLSFAPSLNIPTPQDYELGPEDEVIISIFGAATDTYREVISPEGAITIDRIGPIYLSGLTVEEAKKHLINKLTSTYAGLKKNGSTDTYLQLSLGNIRSIQVSLVGEVFLPGTYTIPSLASVFNALYTAGGPTDNGTFRAVKVIRNGEIIHELDLYDFLVKGTLDYNIKLKDQDVIKVDPYINRISITGEVKVAGLYESKEGETFQDLLIFAGGFNEQAYTKRIKLLRNTNTEKRFLEIDFPQQQDLVLHNGDVITVTRILGRIENQVEVQGAVFRPGRFELEKNLTVFTLIQNAEGIREDAFTKRAILYRRNADLALVSISIDLRELLSNPAKYDLPLKQGDVLRILSKYDLEEAYSVSISGAVNSPGTFTYVQNQSVEDLVFQAGGFMESAASYNIEVARRILDDGTGEYKNVIAEIFRIEANDSLGINDDSDQFKLEPFDEVFVRTSPTYQTQQRVFISGEIKYPGEYVLEKRNYRLSDLVTESGNPTEYAYLEGAVLFRKFENYLNLDFVDDREALSDSLLEVPEEEPITLSTVGIRLDKAIRNPGSIDDLILLPGDSLAIPQELETVSIRGEVFYPINVRYRPNKKFRNYISSAGGYTDLARKRNSYIIYANGEVAKPKKFLFFTNYPDVKPGATIVAPKKIAREKLSRAERITLYSTIISLAAIVTNTIFQIQRSNNN